MFIDICRLVTLPMLPDAPINMAPSSPKNIPIISAPFYFGFKPDDSFLEVFKKNLILYVKISQKYTLKQHIRYSF